MSCNFAHAKRFLPSNQFAIPQRYFYITIEPFFRYPDCFPYCLTKDGQFLKDVIYLNTQTNWAFYSLDFNLPSDNPRNQKRLYLNTIPELCTSFSITSPIPADITIKEEIGNWPVTYDYTPLITTSNTVIGIVAFNPNTTDLAMTMLTNDYTGD